MDDTDHLEAKSKVGCFKRPKKIEAARTIHINQNFHHKGYKDNRTSTTKYNLFTYLPKSLFEQYRYWPLRVRQVNVASVLLE
jgi:hypothetical protein